MKMTDRTRILQSPIDAVQLKSYLEQGQGINEFAEIFDTPSGWAPAQPPEPTRPDSPRPAWRGSYRADNPAHTEPLEDSDTRWDSLTLVP